ncbi:CzcD Co/Zn/Cd efflux system component [Comamonadaceae bacterium]
MSHACEHHTPATGSILNLARYRRVLWIALWINAAMFGIELFSGWHSGSLSLLADSIDFAGDALNYGVSLAVLSAALAWRARAAVVKALCMMGFGALILGRAVWTMHTGTVPDGTTMGAVGLLALIANVAVAWMLYAFREGDANMRSVWLCSRNDAIGNVLVMLAAAGVLGTGSGWPDLLVAACMAAMALHGGWQVMRQARRELAGGQDAAHAHHDHHHGHSH